MRITRLGHSCVLVASGGRRILIDPGTFSQGFANLEGLDAVVVTHSHPDHLDPARWPDLLKTNPRAEVFTDPMTAQGTERALATCDGLVTHIGEVTLRFVGRRHAFIHDCMPEVPNMGVVISAPGDVTFFHPGDSYDAAVYQAATGPGGNGKPVANAGNLAATKIDVLAVPVNAPWAAISDTIAFVRRISPKYAFAIHDAFLSAAGQTMYGGHISKFTGTNFEYLQPGEPRTYSGGRSL